MHISILLMILQMKQITSIDRTCLNGDCTNPILSTTNFLYGSVYSNTHVNLMNPQICTNCKEGHCSSGISQSICTCSQQSSKCVKPSHPNLCHPTISTTFPNQPLVCVDGTLKTDRPCSHWSQDKQIRHITTKDTGSRSCKADFTVKMFRPINDKLKYGDTIPSSSHLRIASNKSKMCDLVIIEGRCFECVCNKNLHCSNVRTRTDGKSAFLLIGYAEGNAWDRYNLFWLNHNTEEQILTMKHFVVHMTRSHHYRSPELTTQSSNCRHNYNSKSTAPLPDPDNYRSPLFLQYMPYLFGITVLVLIVLLIIRSRGHPYHRIHSALVTVALKSHSPTPILRTAGKGWTTSGSSLRQMDHPVTSTTPKNYSDIADQSTSGHKTKTTPTDHTYEIPDPGVVVSDHQPTGLKGKVAKMKKMISQTKPNSRNRKSAKEIWSTAVNNETLDNSKIIKTINPSESAPTPAMNLQSPEEPSRGLGIGIGKMRQPEPKEQKGTENSYQEVIPNEFSETQPINNNNDNNNNEETPTTTTPTKQSRTLQTSSDTFSKGIVPFASLASKDSASPSPKAINLPIPITIIPLLKRSDQDETTVETIQQQQQQQQQRLPVQQINLA